MDRTELLSFYDQVRSLSEALCQPMEIEDYVLQAMEDASPPLWNLAHTSWFFEQFLLRDFETNFVPYNETYLYLFNSYYLLAGPRHSRSRRGLISRPTVKEMYAYRHNIDERVHALLESLSEEDIPATRYIIVLGLNHEQQHQELLLTDHKYNLSINPLRPAYRNDLPLDRKHITGHGQIDPQWVAFPEGPRVIGYGENGFYYDNEAPVHKVYLHPFALRSTLVTNREYLQFIEDGGYDRPELWLSDGWIAREKEGWESPLYWEKQDGRWSTFTFGGMRELAADEPVTHISHYEADAFAAWAGKRLPTEFEWETAVKEERIVPDASKHTMLDDMRLHPCSPIPDDSSTLLQMYGDVWEWTNSAYLPYPGFYQAEGAVGEYNGKFMSGQRVLKGGSCVTPSDHIRPTYRNFWHPDKRWQFTGIRLATEV